MSTYSHDFSNGQPHTEHSGDCSCPAIVKVEVRHPSRPTRFVEGCFDRLDAPEHQRIRLLLGFAPQPLQLKIDPRSHADRSSACGLSVEGANRDCAAVQVKVSKCER